MRLPKSYKDVTIQQLVELQEIDKDKTIDQEPAPDITRALLKLSVFTGVPFEKLEEMPLKESLKGVNQLEFLNELPKDKPRKRFNLGGYTWKINYDVTDISFGKYVDFDMLVRDREKVLENSAKILSLFCTPYKWFKEVKMEDKDKWEILKSVPVSVAYPSAVFFCLLLTNTIDSLPDYLLKQANQLKKEAESLAQSSQVN